MKLTTIILLTASLQVAARSDGQTVTLKEKDASLEKIFVKIRKQTGYNFFYADISLQDAKKVTIEVYKVEIRQALEICFKDQPFIFTIIGTTIIVKQNRNEKNPEINDGELSISDTIPRILVSGRITDSAQVPLGGISIFNRNTRQGTVTSAAGAFGILARQGDLLEASYVGMKMQLIKVRNVNSTISAVMTMDIKTEQAVTILATGYETVSPERTTGSFVKIDNTLLNRSVSTNILDRLNGVASGILFHGGTSDVGFSIRGRSTIFANTSPLIILDNFPYDGNLSTINPNDVESITILRDAGAASIWGVRAGNGVVVITSKKGSYGKPLQVSINSNVTMTEKPDLYGRPDMSTSDIIEVEKFLFENGAYVNTISTKFAYISPVVDILNNKKNGTISEEAATAQINQLRNFNNKDDLLKYYYKNKINQQYAVNFTGGGQYNKYYLSLGFDKNTDDLISNSFQRVTINGTNTYSLFDSKLEISTGIMFTSGYTVANSRENSFVNRPYIMYADEVGNSLTALKYRQQWVDTVGAGTLLDWSWKPYEEMQRKNIKAKLTNYLLNVGVKYKIIKSIDISVLYQYSKGANEGITLNGPETFYTRDYINQFSQINYSTKAVTRPVPLGAIQDKNNGTYQSHNLRGQLSYNAYLGNLHHISVFGGAEMKDYGFNNSSYRVYGLVGDIGAVIPVNFQTQYKTIFTGSSSLIANNLSESWTTDRYFSYYGNAVYTYNRKYTISASARKDESNLFGVKANQKGVPLFSIGGSWKISNEKFWNLSKWIPDLRLRVSNGINGNVDKSVSAFTTARLGSTNPFLSPTITLVNPPNPSLKWEKINITNIALDFALKNEIIRGSIEYYTKRGRDIIGNSPLAPSSGITDFRGNSADIKGSGFDVSFNIQSISNQNFRWNTMLLFSHNTDKIASYKANTSPLGFHEGYPVTGIISYRWAGLDNSGNPQGYLNSTISKAWSTIVNTDSIGKNTIYSGPGTPTYFGSIINSLSWRGLNLSFNIIYKGGYNFRANSINYGTLFQLTGLGHSDFSFRWEKPGDEKFTNVPAMTYPLNPSRELFYTNSEVLVQKGDVIRLQDIRFSYALDKRGFSWLPVQTVSLYAYAQNIAILWRSNNHSLDPDYLTLPPQKSFSFGLMATL